MPRRALVPPALRHGPFTILEAGTAGVTASALRSGPWRRVGKGLYCWTHATPDPWLLLAAWQRAMSGEATFSGHTAAWMFGLDCGATIPTEVTVPTTSGARSCRGLVVRHCDLVRGEIVEIHKLPCTSTLRTLRDLCMIGPQVEALVAFDMAVRLRLVTAVDLSRYAGENSGLPGAARMRELASLAEPAESAMETRLRWLLIAAGLPRPVVQRDLKDHRQHFLGRADLYYPPARLVIEFDGGTHRERLVSDDRRQNQLVNAGYRILRFTTADLKGRPDDVVALVREALAPGLHYYRRFEQNARNSAA